MPTTRWNHCDVVVRDMAVRVGVSGETTQPAASLEIQFIPTAIIIACAIADDLPHDLALKELAQYIARGYPGIRANDLSLEHGWDDHIVTGNPAKESIIFITKEGCTLGPPS